VEQGSMNVNTRFQPGARQLASKSGASWTRPPHVLVCAPKCWTSDGWWKKTAEMRSASFGMRRSAAPSSSDQWLRKYEAMNRDTTTACAPQAKGARARKYGWFPGGRQAAGRAAL